MTPDEALQRVAMCRGILDAITYEEAIERWAQAQPIVDIICTIVDAVTDRPPDRARRPWTDCPSVPPPDESSWAAFKIVALSALEYLGRVASQQVISVDDIEVGPGPWSHLPDFAFDAPTPATDWSPPDPSTRMG